MRLSQLYIDTPDATEDDGTMSEQNLTQPITQMEYMDKQNAQTIKEFLKERRKLQTDLNKTMDYIQQQVKNKSLSKDHCERQLDLVLTSHESTRVELLDLLMRYLKI